MAAGGVDGDAAIVPWAQVCGNSGPGSVEKETGIGDGVVAVPQRRRRKGYFRTRRPEIVEAGVHRPTFVAANNVELGVRKRGRIHSQKFGFCCHYCRQKTIEDHAQCCFCVLKWCPGCLQNRLGEDLLDIRQMDRWVCPRCRRGCGPGCMTNCCNCGPCRKQQGLQPTGFIVKTARSAGFNNAHDYLVHLQTGDSPDTIASRRYQWIKFPQEPDVVANAIIEPEHRINAIMERGQLSPAWLPLPRAICPAKQATQSKSVQSPPPLAVNSPADSSGRLTEGPESQQQSKSVQSPLPLAVNSPADSSGLLTEGRESQLQHMGWGKTKFRSTRFIAVNMRWEPMETVFSQTPELLRLRLVSMGTMWEVGRKFNMK